MSRRVKGPLLMVAMVTGLIIAAVGCKLAHANLAEFLLMFCGGTIYGIFYYVFVTT